MEEKELGMAYFKVQTSHSSGKSEESKKNPQ
jgi:hypothetical protein